MDVTGSLVLRTAVDRDLPQICELLAARGDDADADDVMLVAGDPDEGLDAVMVVVDGDRVVSTATLLRESLSIGGVDLPAGQIEMVATDPVYEGRGLVRALMTEAHRRSAERGDLLQVMIGIPFFYRQFGYSYSMPIPQPWTVHTRPPADPELSVRIATAGDIAAMTRLQAAVQADADVRMPHSPACWRWLVERPGSSQLVAERYGEVVATGRRTPPEEGVVLGEVAGQPDGIRALVADSADRGSAGRGSGDLGPSDPAEVMVIERPAAGLGEVLADIADPPEQPERAQEWFYARIDALAPLLGRLAPVLLDRFRAAGLSGRRDVLLSSWRSHVRFSIDEDSMSAVAAGGPEQAPVSKGGSGVPPDQLAPLLLGPFGAAGLEGRNGDVILGRQRELMEVLFPSVTSDLLTFYLAV